MAALLRLIDEAPGMPRRPAGSLRLASERITAREVIQRRVEAEVSAYNAAPNGIFAGLVQPRDAARESAGFRLKSGRILDAQVQAMTAIEAFERNRIVMLFNDRQVERLDEVLTVEPDSEVTFLRLVPLVGG
jgi:hypothetical protein